MFITDNWATWAVHLVLVTCLLSAALVRAEISDTIEGVVDAGLLASGIIPAVRHCLDNLLTADARVIPASATVYAQVWYLSLLCQPPSMFPHAQVGIGLCRVKPSAHTCC